MRKLVDGQDGLCGNFNCGADDDQKPAVQQRLMDFPIEQNQSAFRDCPPPPKAQTKRHGEKPDVQKCEGELYEQAKKMCESLQQGPKDDCIFDVCASKDPEAGTADVAIEALAENLQEKFHWLEHLGHLAFPGLSIS